MQKYRKAITVHYPKFRWQLSEPIAAWSQRRNIIAGPLEQPSLGRFLFYIPVKRGNAPRMGLSARH